MCRDNHDDVMAEITNYIDLNMGWEFCWLHRYLHPVQMNPHTSPWNKDCDFTTGTWYQKTLVTIQKSKAIKYQGPGLDQLKHDDYLNKISLNTSIIYMQYCVDLQNCFNNSVLYVETTVLKTMTSLIFKSIFSFAWLFQNIFIPLYLIFIFPTRDAIRISIATCGVSWVIFQCLVINDGTWYPWST